eukprot:g4766.t1
MPDDWFGNSPTIDFRVDHRNIARSEGQAERLKGVIALGHGENIWKFDHHDNRGATCVQAVACSADLTLVGRTTPPPSPPPCKYRLDNKKGEFLLADLCHVQLGFDFTPNMRNQTQYYVSHSTNLFDENDFAGYKGTTQEVKNAAARECARGYLYANLLREALFFVDHNPPKSSPYQWSAKFDWSEDAAESTLEAVVKLQASGTATLTEDDDYAKAGSYWDDLLKKLNHLVLAPEGSGGNRFDNPKDVQKYIEEKYIGKYHATTASDQKIDVQWSRSTEDLDPKKDFVTHPKLVPSAFLCSILLWQNFRSVVNYAGQTLSRGRTSMLIGY